MTYTLNNDSVAAMVQGNLMPRPMEILLAVLMITFVGQERLALHKIQCLFCMQQVVVAQALHWLKIFNPVYYGGVKIEPARLARVPEDGVPLEISSVIHHCIDEGLVEQENSGYMNKHLSRLDGPLGI
jgi:hypothetical protein